MESEEERRKEIPGLLEAEDIANNKRILFNKKYDWKRIREKFINVTLYILASILIFIVTIIFIIISYQIVK
jgi:hypothetical protein